MGLFFEQLAECPYAAALSAARKDLSEALEVLHSQTERLEALAASALRIKDEVKQIQDRVVRLSLAAPAALRQLAEDPSATDDLYEHVRDGQDAAAQLRELVRANEAMNRDLAAVEYEVRLARGRAKAAGNAVELAAVMQSFAELKAAADTARSSSSAAAAADGDASSGDVVERATSMDHD